jgi:hypothetical protein
LKFSTKLPAIYFRIIPEFLELEYAEETIATCENCNLCKSKQSPYIDTKCCTYQPYLANYLVGGVLVDIDPSLSKGKEIIKEQILARKGVTPYGIIPSHDYIKRERALKSIDFWKVPKEEMTKQLCSYYDDGNCTVWKYREHLCVTHFCSSVGGSKGKEFWKTIDNYLKMAETSLSQYAMLKLEWDVLNFKTKRINTDDFKLEDENGNIIDENYSALWGEWEGRELEFYKQCFEIVNEIDSNTFQKITGIQREILEAAIWKSNAIYLENLLPQKMILHPDIIQTSAEENQIVLTLEKQTVKIPVVIYPLVKAFNGARLTSEVFHLGYNIQFSMNEIVDELWEKGLLIKA